MVTAVNARDVALAATSPRILPIALPTNLTIDFAGVTGTTKPANNATVNRVTRQSAAPTSPTPVDGDIWVDTSVTPNIIRTRIAGTWQASASYTTNTNHLTDGANLGGTATWPGVTGTGKPADYATVNRIFRQASAPTSPTPIDGDIWIDTSTTPNIIKTRISSSWVSSGSLVTDTAQITDGAQLGLTATWAGVTGTGKPANYADVTTTILGASGTSIVMTNANLFKSSSGAAGVFIGSGGLIGKDSGGTTTFSIDGASGAAMFAGSLSAATGTFAGSLSAATGTFAGTLSASCINGGTFSGASIQISAPSYGWLLNAGHNGTVVGYRQLNGYNIYAGNLSSPGSSPVIGASGTAAAGLYGFSTGTGGHGVRGEAGSALGFVGYDQGSADFYAYGLGIYMPFTGSHDALILKNSGIAVGDIVVDIGVAVRKNISNTICKVELSSSLAQSSAVGVASAEPKSLELVHSLPSAMLDRMWTTQPDGERVENLIPAAEWYDLRLTYDSIVINALGEGQLNVSGMGGNLQPGDLITTSSIPGKGMKQADNVIRSHTVAKCRETVVFDDPAQVKLVACIYLCG